VFCRKRDDELLLVSGFGDTSGGGIFLVAEGEVEQLDAMSSTGLAVGNGRVGRLLRSATELYGSELLVYDEAGIECYFRLDGYVDLHDIVWDGSHYVVASTAANSVFWLSPSGDVVRRWAALGHGDARHLNSLSSTAVGCSPRRSAASRATANGRRATRLRRDSSSSSRRARASSAA
jgi:hypothetical protein